MPDPTTPVRAPRDVIEDALPTILKRHTGTLYTEERVKVVIHPEAVDAIITALSDAGYEIVRAAPEPDAPEITESERAGLRWILTTVMSEISEAHNCTTWDMALSKSLFRIVDGGDDPHRYRLNDRTIGGLRFLREALGEWPKYNTDPETWDCEEFIWTPVDEYRAALTAALKARG